MKEPRRRWTNRLPSRKGAIATLALAFAACPLAIEQGGPRHPGTLEPARVREFWVCHGDGEYGRWLRMSETEAESHRNHGDPVSTAPQTAGERCERR